MFRAVAQDRKRAVAREVAQEQRRERACDAVAQKSGMVQPRAASHHWEKAMLRGQALTLHHARSECEADSNRAADARRDQGTTRRE